MNEVTLTHGQARATIALLGAELRTWRVSGRDLLWRGDPAIWPDISPILYPVVGWTRDGERVGGRHYPLGLHGFARFETFRVAASEPDFVRLTLSDTERTRTQYPFAFRLAVEYRLGNDGLAITLEVANPGEGPGALRLRPASGLSLADRRGRARGRRGALRARRTERGSRDCAGRARQQGR